MQRSRKQDNPIPLTFATYRKDRKNNINKKHHLNAMYVSTLKLQPGICLKTVFALLLAASASACHCRNARTNSNAETAPATDRVDDAVISRIEEYPVGGIALFSRNITSAEQLPMFISDLQSSSKYPLFIAVDERIPQRPVR